MAVTIPPLTNQRTGEQTSPGRRGFLFGPLADFVLLGGGSLIILLAIRAAAAGMADGFAWSLAVTVTLAMVVNHPHFAASYLIFYSDFHSKLTSPTYEITLRRRYFLVGVAAPVALCGFFTACITTGNAAILGLSASGMTFLVGWHYVKQGFGMAMLDAALKRRFFDTNERKIMLLNAYAVWILAWLLMNRMLADETTVHFGIPFVLIPVPNWLLGVACTVALATSVRCIWLLVARYRARKLTAWNGVAGYAIALYIWLLAREPILLLWVPLFHSLQYLGVVTRYKLNEAAQKEDSWGTRRLKFTLFAVSAIGLGYVGFWVLPQWLTDRVDYDRTLFGGSLFFFLTWVFINVHHYLLDSVMWRKGNPDVARNLFQSGAPVTPRSPPA